MTFVDLSAMRANFCMKCKDREVSWLKQYNFVTVRYISTKLGGKLYIFLFNSSVKFHAKVHTHC